MSRKKETTIRGVTYESRAEAARALGVTEQAIALAVKQGRLQTVGISPRLRNQNYGAAAKPFTYKDLTFPSRRAAARAINVTDSWFYKVLSYGNTEQRLRMARAFERVRSERNALKHQTKWAVDGDLESPGMDDTRGIVPRKKSCVYPSNMQQCPQTDMQ